MNPTLSITYLKTIPNEIIPDLNYECKIVETKIGKWI